jgi:hypothetical protein
MIIQGVALENIRVVDASIITQNLAIWIDANNASSYSGTGTNVTDLSGNGRTQVLSSAGIYSMLNGVKCFDCTTTGQITASSIGPVLPTSGFTYIAWARMNSSSATFRTLFRTNPNDHPLLININTNNLGMWDNDGLNFVTANYDVSSLADVWAQWTVVGDSAGQQFYINGVLVGSTNVSSAGNSHWYIGSVSNGQPFGYIANVELYTAKLTQEQILQNYYNQLPKFTTPEIVTSNLVLWYDPSNSVSYPGSGSTITNLANTSLPGTLSNITYTDPYFSYNGTSSQINVPDNALLEPGTGDWTMEAWVYLSSSSGSKVVLGKFDPGGGSQDVSYSIRIQGAGIYAQLGNGTTVVDTALYTLPLNTWTHVTYVWKNIATNSLEAYINGVSVGSVSHSFASILNTSANLYIGSYNGGEYSQYMNGRIGITRLYNAALTSAQVLQNYNADKSKYGL